jgi:chemotaxis protein MotB
MAGILAKLPNHITIEGHTDARQYSTREGYTNWELSTDRAHSARKAMEAAGLPHGRVDRVIGHADRVLLVPSHPEHASNRRISVLVRRQHPPDAVAGTRPAS